MTKIYPPTDQVIRVYPNYVPVRSLGEYLQHIGQRFGEDLSLPACKYNSSYPCDKSLYQYLGLKAHNGLDIGLIGGLPILAAHDGIITEISKDISAGYGVVVWDKVQKVKTIYWHLKSWAVEIGEQVKTKQVIGYGDNTGLSSGDHLHFGMKFTNEKGETINYSNGYFGAVDPLPYLCWWTINYMECELWTAGKDIYRIKDGKKDLFLNAHSFEALDGRWQVVKTKTQAELDKLPDGDVLIAVPNE